MRIAYNKSTVHKISKCNSFISSNAAYTIGGQVLYTVKQKNAPL